MLLLILGDTALQRCGNHIAFTAALQAAEKLTAAGTTVEERPFRAA